jgi:hypothetical protein
MEDDHVLALPAGKAASADAKVTGRKRPREGDRGRDHEHGHEHRRHKAGSSKSAERRRHGGEEKEHDMGLKPVHDEAKFSRGSTVDTKVSLTPSRGRRRQRRSVARSLRWMAVHAHCVRVIKFPP